MTRTTTKPGSPLDISALVKKLDVARSTLAHYADKDYYDRHHPERSELDTVFDDLIDFLLDHQAPAQLDTLIKLPTDPNLQPGDLITLDGRPSTVRQIRFHAPHTHKDSGLPQHQAAMEIVTSQGSKYLSLAPQA